MDARTFPAGVLDHHASVKGFTVVAVDGRAGRVSWASYAPGESYLVVSVGRLRPRHRVLPAGAVTNITDDEVRVALSRADIQRLPALPHPQAPVGDDAVEHMLNAFERAASLPQSGGF